MDYSKTLITFPVELKNLLQESADQYYLSLNDIVKIACVKYLKEEMKSEIISFPALDSEFVSQDFLEEEGSNKEAYREEEYENDEENTEVDPLETSEILKAKAERETLHNGDSEVVKGIPFQKPEFNKNYFRKRGERFNK